MRLGIAKDGDLDLAAVPDAVRSAGFKAGWMWARCNDGGSTSIVRLDTRSASPRWEPEMRDLEAVLHQERDR